MAILFFLLFLFSFLVFIVGLISPKKVITWGSKKTHGQVLLTYGIATMVIFFAFIAAIPSVDTTLPITEEAKAQVERKERIDKQFSPWDGSHDNLKKLIKHHMNDPDSYKHEETIYWDKKDHLIIRTTYRGKNAFGGYMKETVKAKVDLDGNILEILGQWDMYGNSLATH